MLTLIRALMEVLVHLNEDSELSDVELAALDELRVQLEYLLGDF